MPRERDLFTPDWRRREQRLEAVEIALVVAIAIVGMGALLMARPPAPPEPGIEARP